MEAAAAAAIECNVEAYLRWLPTNVHLEPAGAFTIPQKDEVDWIEQLYSELSVPPLCQESKLTNRLLPYE
jgi:hypothetical protein